MDENRETLETHTSIKPDGDKAMELKKERNGEREGGREREREGGG